ncbi:hypothetical protein NQ176_g1273 [Zarea fungicola]|uniref:Uncharacterized protein n=1 Tax=Zarea fungicola TaxID=93591 RepID=A0ACC1NTI0_9HYPO|nr:hypothetical protein NQ176_g1273 [Lecanicillium fungicola]
MKFATVVPLLVSTAAAIDVAVVQLFDGPSCNQNSLKPDKVVGVVSTNPFSKNNASACLAIPFNSVKFTSLPPGFACNFFSDTQCQTLAGSLNHKEGCDVLQGASVLCFNADEVNNKFQDSTVSLAVGVKSIGVSQNTGSLFIQGIEQACGDTACDPTSPKSFPYQHFNQNGFTTITLTGSYSNTAQRDYMKAILVSAQQKTLHNLGIDTKGSSEDADLVADQFTFFQIVIRGPDGGIQCQMTATINTTTQPVKQGDCGVVGTLESFALGAIPAVGGLAAKAFDFVCQHS